MYEKVSIMRRTIVKKTVMGARKLTLAAYNTFFWIQNNVKSKVFDNCFVKQTLKDLYHQMNCYVALIIYYLFAPPSTGWEISKNEEMFGNQLGIKLYPVILPIWLIIMPSELFLKFKKNTDTFCFVLNCRTILKLISVKSMKFLNVSNKYHHYVRLGIPKFRNGRSITTPPDRGDLKLSNERKKSRKKGHIPRLKTFEIFTPHFRGSAGLGFISYWSSNLPLSNCCESTWHWKACCLRTTGLW